MADPSLKADSLWNSQYFLGFTTPEKGSTLKYALSQMNTVHSLIPFH